MSGECNINRLEYLILCKLYSNDCKDYFNSCTITELMEETNGALATRMTVYKKLQKLVKGGYVSKGVTDDHADTYFIMEKGVNLINGGSKANESEE